MVGRPLVYGGSGRDGGTGRRAGLKIPWASAREGSTPSPGTDRSLPLCCRYIPTDPPEKSHRRHKPDTDAALRFVHESEAWRRRPTLVRAMIVFAYLCVGLVAFMLVIVFAIWF
jgi:hypothetical protein